MCPIRDRGHLETPDCDLLITSMSNLARPINRTLPARPNSAGKTKVLLLRQPIKSVRREDDASQAGYRLALGASIAVGVIGTVWLLGHLGFRLGFAHMLGLPELLTEPGGGLTTGALLVMTLPLRVIEAGVIEPMWLLAAFCAIMAPAGWLAGAKPQVRGGPKPTQLTVVGWWSASILATLMAGLFVAYAVAPFRREWTAALPDDLVAVDAWLANWSIAAGLDGLVVVAASLWMVLAFRVTVPLWMKSLSVAACIFALCVAGVAMSMSNATVVHLQADRSVVVMNDTADTTILLGYTRHHAAVMQVEADSGLTVRMFDAPGTMQAQGRRSLAAALLDAMPRDEF